MSKNNSKDLIIVDEYEMVSADVRAKLEEIETDLDEVKNNLTTTATKLNLQLDEVIDFAKAAPHPKTYEALAKVVAAIALLNKETAAVIKQKNDFYNSIKNNVNNNEKNVVINDNRNQSVFVGTSTELLDQVLNKNKND